MNNQYITDTIIAQQTGGAIRLSEAELREITEREHHVSTTIADRQRQLENIIAMQEWYRQNAQAVAQMEDTTAHHGNVNKQYLALRSEEMRLQLFDSIQEFRPFYEHVNERRRVLEGLKMLDSELSQKAEQLKERVAEAERQYEVAKERLEGAKEQLQNQQSTINDGYSKDGEIKTLVAQLISTEDTLAELQRQQDEREALLRNRQNEILQTKKQLEELSLHHQALAVHQQLFEQYQSVNDKLQLYNTESKFNDHVHQQFTLNNRRSSDLSVQHDKMKKQLQSKSDRFEALLEDRKVHETAIEELDSNTLYHRYAQCQQRQVQLLSARQVWQTISKGYDDIETQRSAIERMVRQLDQKRQEQEVAERDVKRLYERYTRLNKAYILLQIENTRKLREGLKEGTPCPVCGSAHHPYHTEVEQELGETQTQLEKDYHTAKKEYEARQVSAAEVVAEAQSRAGQLDAERKVLERMMEQQHILEEDWERFKRLDSSFTICSSSVNRDARRATIEMLIDSTNRHLKEYEQLIARYDFHTSQLRSIAKEAEESKKEVDDLQKKFWKMDTELQLVHERVENYRTLMTQSDDRIEQLYKDLDDVVTVSGWRDDNLEEFSKSLSELYLDWTMTSKNLERNQYEFEVLQLKASTAEADCQRMAQLVNAQREERDRLRELLSSKREDLRKSFGSMSPAEFANSLLQAISNAQSNCQEASTIYEDLQHDIAALEGERQMLVECRQQQEERLREQSTSLDHAIARYNLTHSAIQSSELDTIFSDTRDWMLLRQTVTECHDALLIASERMQQAEHRFMDLQSAPERPAKDREEDSPENLAKRHTDLVLELEALRGELADIRRIINRHEAS